MVVGRKTPSIVRRRGALQHAWSAGCLCQCTSRQTRLTMLLLPCCTDMQSSDALYGILLVGGRVLGVETGKGPPPVNVYDLLLLANFTNSNESLRCVVSVQNQVGGLASCNVAADCICLVGLLESQGSSSKDIQRKCKVLSIWCL